MSGRIAILAGLCAVVLSAAIGNLAGFAFVGALPSPEALIRQVPSHRCPRGSPAIAVGAIRCIRLHVCLVSLHMKRGFFECKFLIVGHPRTVDVRKQ